MKTYEHIIMTVFLKKFIKSISLLFFTLILFSSQTFAGVTFVDSFDISGQQSYPHAVQFNNDGTKMFVIGTGTGTGADAKDVVNEYTLSTGFDVSTASYVDGFDHRSQEGIARALAFNNDGTKMFVMGTGGDDVNEYTLSTGFDVSSASFVDSFIVNYLDQAG